MTTLPPIIAVPTARLPMRQKVGYGLGSFLDMWGHWLYQSLAFQVFNIFLGVAPGLISTVMAIKIGIDAASDAVFGWLSDNARSRWGRRRPFILVGVGLPHMIVGRMIKKRMKQFIARFPDAIELLVRGLRSGLPISETMGVVGTEVPDPVGAEFRAVADRMRIGRTMEQALQETADKLNTPEFQFFVITLAIQRETGGNLAETLGNLADVLRKRMQMKLKIGAMSSESKASAYIIGALPFFVFGIIYWMNPAYMGAFFTDQRLVYTAIGGGIWMAIGVFIMAKMINFEI